jgi:hypothetical protein
MAGKHRDAPPLPAPGYPRSADPRRPLARSLARALAGLYTLCPVCAGQESTVSHTSPTQHPDGASSPLCPEGEVTMDAMAKHERETTPDAKAASRTDIWFVLVLTGGASAFLQMWHATHSGSTAGIVDGIVGLVPAATAIGLSHAVVSHKAAAWLRVITVAVMLAFMAAAASASASVVQPVEMRDFNWVFSLALDAAELACVWMLLGNSERKAAEAAAVVLAEQVAEEARTAAEDAARKAAWHETELARVGTELAETRGALEAERARRVSAPKRRRVSAPKRAAASPPNGSASSPPNTDAVSPPETNVPEDVDTQAEALRILAAEPDISGSKLGLRLGKTERYGQMLKSKLAPSVPGPDSGGQS